jgi:hypothetical protein
MTFVSEITEHWFGLCRKAPVFRASQTFVDDQPEPAHEGRPDGGSGGPGTILRGTGAALSGMKILIHNPQLLWFSLFTALVLVAHLITQWALMIVSVNNGSDLIGLPAVAFAVELPTVFCLVFLLAGLALSLSPENAGPGLFFQGLDKAKKYLIPLAGWSVVVALAGTLIFIVFGISSDALNSVQLHSQLHSFDIYGTLRFYMEYALNQFPFNWSLFPNTYIVNPYEDMFPISSGFSNALEYTLIFSAINTLLLALTLFVVPLLVLEEKRLKEAVSGSFTLMKKIRGEAAACVLGLGMVVFAASLTSLLFRVAAGLVNHPSWEYEAWFIDGALQISSSRPGNEWIAAGLLYVLILACFVLFVATVGGIATMDLYKYAKTRESEA